MGDVPQLPGSDYTVPEGMTGEPLFGKPSQADKDFQKEMLQKGYDMSNQLWENTATMRENIGRMLNRYTAGKFDITTNPMFAGGMADIGNAYKTARENLISSMPIGGQLNSELGKLELGRAMSMTDLVSQIQADLLNKAYTAGYGTPQTSIAGANSAAGNAANYLIQQQNMGRQNAMGFGQMLGYMMNNNSGKGGSSLMGGGGTNMNDLAGMYSTDFNMGY